MNRIRSRAREEDGVILVLVLGFLAFIGVVAAVLVNYTTTGHRATVTVQDIRAREYAADGVVEAAINLVRRTAASSNSSGCVVAMVDSLSMRVDCSDAGTGGVEVTFTACPNTGVACTASTRTLVAKAKYNRTVSPAAVKISAWSVHR
ncbi:MAG: hypothetical protein AB1679_28645 [Actinomycetota bacterium]|jgi:hypothetical protein